MRRSIASVCCGDPGWACGESSDAIRGIRGDLILYHKKQKERKTLKEAKTPGAMRVMYHHHCIVTEKSLAEEEMKVKDGISFQVSNVTTAMLVPDEGAMHPRLFQKHMLTNRDG